MPILLASLIFASNLFANERLYTFLEKPMRSPGEVTLAFKGEPLVSFSLHGSTLLEVGWEIPDLFQDCADFEANMQHIEVRKFDQIQSVSHFLLQGLTKDGHVAWSCPISPM